MTMFWLETFLFIFFLFTCLYLPGKLLLLKLKFNLSSLENLFLPFGVGVVLFTLLCYILSFLRLSFLILPFILGFDLLAIRTKKIAPVMPEKKHIKPLALITVMSVLFSLPMELAGKIGDVILYRHDDLWHLALVNALKAHFPPNAPTYSGAAFTGYHFFHDFMVANASSIFHISPLSLHFKFIPLFLALMWGVGTYTLLFLWSKKVSAGLIGTFFTMFGGSFAFILYLMGHTSINIDAGLHMEQPMNGLYNAPLAMSIVILITILISIYRYLEKEESGWLVPLTLCVGSIPMFKVYGGIVAMSGFFLLVLLQLYKKNYVILISLFGVGILFLSTFGVFAAGAGTLIYYPLWGPNKLLQSFPWYNYDNKMKVFTEQKVMHGLVETEAYGTILFVLGNLGTRLIGISSLIFLAKKRLPSRFSLVVTIMLLTSILLPLFFAQSVRVYEMIQMTKYYLFLSSLFAGIGLSLVFGKLSKKVKVIFILVLLIFTLPDASKGFLDYFNGLNARQSLSSPDLQTMNFLKGLDNDNFDSVVLILPGKNVDPSDEGIRDWYQNTSSPALTAFANKTTYISNAFIDFTGQNNDSRLKFLKKLVMYTRGKNTSDSDLELILKEMKREKIKYMYATYQVDKFDKTRDIKKIYTNHKFNVYKVL